ncbi:hypothetical protein CFR72_10145 [Gluconacetobacter entanii]|uniref:Uncharacterized protein n=1 Tax=Gluconacetobacter entanii TaxID=108528 RepID=A0A318PUU2_9PROT|nr:hypothetical protein CFR72_10145 [Gluconacetobacter entanii]
MRLFPVVPGMASPYVAGRRDAKTVLDKTPASSVMIGLLDTLGRSSHRGIMSRYGFFVLYDMWFRVLTIRATDTMCLRRPAGSSRLMSRNPFA